MNRRTETCCPERLLTPEIYRMLQYTTFCCCFLLFCGRPKESAILIYRFLLQMRATYICSQLFGLPVKMNGMHWKQSDEARFDLLSLKNLRKAQRWPGKERLHLSCPRTLILFITSFNLGSYSNFYYYILLLLLLLLLLSLLSQSLLVFFLCISRAQTMHLERQSLKSIILFTHWAPFWGFVQIPACRSFESLSH